MDVRCPVMHLAQAILRPWLSLRQTVLPLASFCTVGAIVSCCMLIAMLDWSGVSTNEVEGKHVDDLSLEDSVSDCDDMTYK